MSKPKIKLCGDSTGAKKFSETSTEQMTDDVNLRNLLYSVTF